jgi:hypothetical protein
MTVLATKTPEETKDYSIDWSADLGADTINTSSWSLSPSDPIVTQTSVASSNTLTTVWISGGVSGRAYDVTNSIITAGGRTLTKTFRLYIPARNYL